MIRSMLIFFAGKTYLSFCFFKFLVRGMEKNPIFTLEYEIRVKMHFGNKKQFVNLWKTTNLMKLSQRLMLRSTQ